MAEKPEHSRRHSALEAALADKVFTTALQTMLRKGENGQIFYPEHTPDNNALGIEGIAGEYTRKGLQRWAGANPDGALGPETIKALKAKLGLSPHASIANLVASLKAKLRSDPNNHYQGNSRRREGLGHHLHSHAASTVPESARLVFDESAGTISFQGQVIEAGILSGNGKGLNNPAAQGIRNIGPIPDGNYKIGAPTDKFSAVMGHDAMPLTSEKRTRGKQKRKTRSGFYLHTIIAGVLPGPGTKGCVGTPDSAAQEKLVAFIQSHNISDLKVTHAKGNIAPQDQPSVRAKIASSTGQPIKPTL